LAVQGVIYEMNALVPFVDAIGTAVVEEVKDAATSTAVVAIENLGHQGMAYMRALGDEYIDDLEAYLGDKKRGKAEDLDWSVNPEASSSKSVKMDPDDRIMDMDEETFAPETYQEVAEAIQSGMVRSRRRNEKVSRRRHKKMRDELELRYEQKRIMFPASKTTRISIPNSGMKLLMPPPREIVRAAIAQGSFYAPGGRPARRNSFIKRVETMPWNYYRQSKKGGWKRTTKKRYKRNVRKGKPYRKLATKRGVKAMIGRMANQNGYIRIYKSYAGQFGGDYNDVARNVQVAHDGVFINAESLLVDNYFAFPTEGGATQPEAAQRAFTWRKAHIRWQFHNDLTEKYTATFWWILCKDDIATGNTPLVLWQADHGLSNPASGAVIPFVSDFNDYPTRHERFNRHYKILKKVKSVFNPGDTKTWVTKIPSKQKWNAETHDATGYYRGITCFLMVELKGIPTHNWTAMDAEEITVVTRTKTHIEYVFDYEAEWTMTDSLYLDPQFGTVLDEDEFYEGKSLIPDTEQPIRTV